MRWVSLGMGLMLLAWAIKRRKARQYGLAIITGAACGVALDVVGIGVLGLWEYPRQPFMTWRYWVILPATWGVFGGLINMLWDSLSKYSLILIAVILAVAVGFLYEIPNLWTGSWAYFKVPVWLIAVGWLPLIIYNRAAYKLAHKVTARRSDATASI